MAALDTARRLTSVTSPPTPAAPGGLVTAYGYDADGRTTQVQQRAGATVLRTTGASYTVSGKTATTTDANGNVTGYAYDTLDRLASTTDPMGRVTSYGYDVLSRLNRISNPAIPTALQQRSYTGDGLLATLTDANSHATGFAYDGFDRLATTTYPLGSTETLTYDADGNVLTRKTRAGDILTLTYDTLNRLATKTPPSPTPVAIYGYGLAGWMNAAGRAPGSMTTPCSSRINASS